jgi:hypothetical protein
MDHEEMEEEWMKQLARAAARRRRKLSYVVRRIGKNDPTLTDLFENFQCEPPGADDVQSLLLALERNTRVTNLTIANCSDPAPGCARMLSHNMSLKHLTLLDSQITWMGGIPLFRSLTFNSTLESLNLSNNKLLFRGGGNLFADAVATSLAQMTGLKVLNLSNTGLTGQAIQSIFWGLERNGSLKSLDVSQNSGVAQEIVDSLIQSLPRMKSLERLDVQMTNISACLDQNPDVMAKMVDSFQKNARLWKLDNIVLHRIEHYATCKEQDKQRRCFELLNQLRYIKRRNGLLAGQLLRMDQRALWPRILAHIGVLQRGDDFRLDMMFFLFREKLDLLLPQPSVDAQRPSEMGEPTSKTKLLSARHEKSTRARKRQRHCCRHQLNENYNPGFRCQIHGGVRLVPVECCTFEQMQPFRKCFFSERESDS